MEKMSLAARVRALVKTIRPWREHDHGYVPVCAELDTIAAELERIAEEMLRAERDCMKSRDAGDCIESWRAEEWAAALADPKGDGK